MMQPASYMADSKIEQMQPIQLLQKCSHLSVVVNKCATRVTYVAHDLYMSYNIYQMSE